jgi:hypothetical protein
MTDVLSVIDAQDIVNYLRSFPPGDEAGETMLRNLDRELALRMGAQGGVFSVTRIAGTMVARRPKSPSLASDGAFDQAAIDGERPPLAPRLLFLRCVSPV